MTPDLDNSAGALERLISALLDDPRKLELDANRLPRRVNWRLRVDINDAGKVIGKKGAHVKALALVVSRLGDRLGEVWTLKVEDPEEGPRGEPRRDASPPDHFSPAADLELLSDLLACLVGRGFELDVVADGSADWVFRVAAATFGEHEALVDKRQDEAGETLIGALGTLFRAVGRRQGVGYRVEIPRGATT